MFLPNQRAERYIIALSKLVVVGRLTNIIFERQMAPVKAKLNKIWTNYTMWASLMAKSLTRIEIAYALSNNRTKFVVDQNCKIRISKFSEHFNLWHVKMAHKNCTENWFCEIITIVDVRKTVKEMWKTQPWFECTYNRLNEVL